MQATYIPYKFEEGLVVSNTAKIRNFTIGPSAVLNLSNTSNVVISDKRISEVIPFSTPQTIAPAGTLAFSNIAVSCASNLTWTGNMTVAGDATFSNPLGGLSVSSASPIQTTSATFSVGTWSNLTSFDNISVSGSTTASSTIGTITATSVNVSGTASFSNTLTASASVISNATLTGSVEAQSLDIAGVLRSEFENFTSSTTLSESQMTKRLWILSNSPTLTLPNTDPFVARSGVSTFKTMIKGSGTISGSSKFILPNALTLAESGTTIKWYRLDGASWYGYSMRGTNPTFSPGSNYALNTLAVSGSTTVASNTSVVSSANVSGTLSVTTADNLNISTTNTFLKDIVSVSGCSVQPEVDMSNKLFITKQTPSVVSSATKTLTLSDINGRVIRLATSSTITLPARFDSMRSVEVEFVADNNSITTSFVSSGTCIWDVPSIPLKGSFTLLFNDDGTTCKVSPIGSINSYVNRVVSNLTLTGTLTTSNTILTSPHVISSMSVSNIVDEPTAVTIFNKKKLINSNISLTTLILSNTTPLSSSQFCALNTSKISISNSALITQNGLLEFDITGMTTFPAVHLLYHTVIITNNTNTQSVLMPSSSELEAVFTRPNAPTNSSWTFNILKLSNKKLTLTFPQSISEVDVVFGPQPCFLQLTYTRISTGSFSVKHCGNIYYYETIDDAPSTILDINTSNYSVNAAGSTTCTTLALGFNKQITCGNVYTKSAPIMTSFSTIWIEPSFNSVESGNVLTIKPNYMFSTDGFNQSLLYILTTKPSYWTFRFEMLPSDLYFNVNPFWNSRLIAMQHTMLFNVNIDFKYTNDSYYSGIVKIGDIGSNSLVSSTVVITLPAATPGNKSITYIKLYTDNYTSDPTRDRFVYYKIFGTVISPI